LIWHFTYNVSGCDSCTAANKSSLKFGYDGQNMYPVWCPALGVIKSCAVFSIEIEQG